MDSTSESPSYLPPGTNSETNLGTILSKRKRGPYNTKKKRARKTKTSKIPAEPKERVRKATIENLPPEVIQNILDYTGHLPYFKYRLLRCCSSFKRVIDSQYMILSNLHKISYFAIPKDLTKTRYYFREINQFIRLVEAFMSRNRCAIKDLNIYIEYESSTYSYPDFYVKMLQYHSNRPFTFTIFPHTYYHEVIIKLLRKLKNRETKSKNSIIINDNKYSGLISSIKELDSMPFINYEIFSPPEKCDSLFVSPELPSSLYKSLFNSSNYIYMHEFNELQRLKANGVNLLLCHMHPKIWSNLKHLVLYSKLDKPVLIRYLKLPNLEVLKLISSFTSTFKNNSFPNLKELIVEDSQTHTKGLDFTKNNLESLETLSICTNFISSIHSNILPNSIVKARIDTSIENIIGNFEDLHQIIQSAKILVISVRKYEEMIKLLFSPIHELPLLEKLAIANDVEDSSIVDILNRIKFPNLQVLKLYLLPHLRELSLNRNYFDKLESIYLLSTSIKSIHIRNTFNPHSFKKIIYDAITPQDRYRTRKKYHLYGPVPYYTSNTRYYDETKNIDAAFTRLTEYEFLDLDDQVFKLYQINLTPEIFRKLGNINFDHYGSVQVLGGTDSFHYR